MAPAARTTRRTSPARGARAGAGFPERDGEALERVGRPSRPELPGLPWQGGWEGDLPQMMLGSPLVSQGAADTAITSCMMMGDSILRATPAEAMPDQLYLDAAERRLGPEVTPDAALAD